MRTEHKEVAHENQSAGKQDMQITIKMVFYEVVCATWLNDYEKISHTVNCFVVGNNANHTILIMIYDSFALLLTAILFGRHILQDIL